MRLSTRTILNTVHDGEQWGWPTEFQWLWTNQPEQMAALIVDIAKNGILEPVVIGPDCRMWDGHHRIAAAVALQLYDVPVRYESGEQQ